MLSGFVAPDGTFTYCESYEHLDTAQDIVSKLCGTIMNRIHAEDYLFEHSYIELTSRSASFRFFVGNGTSKRIRRALSDEQKDFLINNLSNANNDSQLEDMKRLLKYNDDINSNWILHCVENKYLQI